jgi:hypothetical protein
VRSQHQPAKRQGFTPVFAGYAVSPLRLPSRYARALVELPRWPLPRIKSGIASAAPDQVHILRTRVQIALLQPIMGRLGIGEPKAL